MATQSSLQSVCLPKTPQPEHKRKTQPKHVQQKTSGMFFWAAEWQAGNKILQNVSEKFQFVFPIGPRTKCFGYLHL
jgi:hypothetical protein